MNTKKNQHHKIEFICLKTPIEEFLSKEDIDYYRKLKSTLSSHICRNCRNRRVESFSEILTTIHYYIMRNNEDSWKRSLICGICWYKNYIVVNIRQMSYLLEKCKSSINGSLQRLSFIVLSDKQLSVKIIIEAFPYLENHPDLIQTWTVRQQMQVPVCVVPFVPINQVNMTKIMKNRLKYQKTNIQKRNVLNSAKKVDINNDVNNIAKNQDENPLKSQEYEENKINNSSNSGIFSNLFDGIDISEELFDKYNNIF